MADDLNSIRTFVLLYETRSVTACAERMHVSQPTVSYTLARLRRRFADDLFRREGNSFVPTAHATRLYDALSGSVRHIDRVLSGPEQLDPAEMRGEFVLALSSMGEISFLPTILGAVARQAPHVRLRVMPLDVAAAESRLLRGEADLAVTMTVLRSERLWRQPFFDVEYVAVTSADHPLEPGEEAMRRRRFVEVAGPGGHFFLREALQEHDLADRVFLVVGGYASVPHALESTDLVALLPRHFAEIFRARHRLTIHALPWNVPSPPVALYTRPARSLSVEQEWLRALALDSLTEALPQYPSLEDGPLPGPLEE